MRTSIAAESARDPLEGTGAPASGCLRVSSLTVADIAERLGCSVDGERDRPVTGLAATDEAGPGDLTLVLNADWASLLRDSSAAAALLPKDLEAPDTSVSLLRVDNVRLAFALVAPLLVPETAPESGIASSAVVHPEASLGADVSIGPGAVVGRDAVIGSDTHIGALTVVEAGAIVGASCRIAANCTIAGCVRMGDRVRLLPGARIGTDGFGFTPGGDGPVKVPQIGLCIIGDDVEIGANSTVDRGALGDTIIGAGTKIDNQVLIAHNARIGRNCMIVGQTGLAGSVTVEDGAQLAGQVGIADHVTIGAGARVGAKSGVFRDVPPGDSHFGIPAFPRREYFRAVSGLLRLHELFKRVAKLEEALGDEAE